MNTNLINVTTPEDVADALGDARAKLTEAKAQVTFLEGLLKAGDQDVIEGSRYRVSISRDVPTVTTNWKAIAAKFDVSVQLRTAYTRTTHSDRVRVSAPAK